MTLLENLALALRALPDEELVEAAAPWIAARVGCAAKVPVASVAAKKGHETRKQNTAAREKNGGGRAVARETSGAERVVDKVFAALAASPKALAVSDLASKLKMTPVSVGSALQSLKRTGRAFNAGTAKFGRWAIDQSMADEAVAALRGAA